MKLFDLHCDTLLEKNSNPAVNLFDMKRAEKFIRAFAIYTPDDLKGEDAIRHFDKLYQRFLKLLEENSDFVSQYPKTDKNVSLILSVENASVLAGDINRIEKFANLGVKLLSLTWNGENELGFGQSKNKGLKTFGKECIPILEKYGIIIDVSHISDRGFEDICAISKKPFIASHSNSRKICNHKRNLSDEQICEIINRKGIIGLNFYKGFLNNDSDKSSANDILRHAEHILSLGGEDILAIGTDFDGCETISEFSCDRELLNISKLFLDNGFSKEQTDKILFNNANKFFNRMCKNELQ